MLYLNRITCTIHNRTINTYSCVYLFSLNMSWDPCIMLSIIANYTKFLTTWTLKFSKWWEKYQLIFIVDWHTLGKFFSAYIHFNVWKLPFSCKTLLGNIRKDTGVFSLVIYWLKYQESAQTPKHRCHSSWLWSFERYSFYTQEWEESQGFLSWSPYTSICMETIRTICSVLCTFAYMTSFFPYS